jgi:hypothetical protein
MLRLPGIQRRWLHNRGLLGGGLAASFGFGAGSFGAGTLSRSRGNLSGCLLLFLIVVLRILLRRVAADMDLEYVAEVFLRQSIELERKLRVS